MSVGLLLPAQEVPLTDFERLRLERIERNKQALKGLLARSPAQTHPNTCARAYTHAHSLALPSIRLDLCLHVDALSRRWEGCDVSAASLASRC